MRDNGNVMMGDINLYFVIKIRMLFGEGYKFYIRRGSYRYKKGI